MEEQMEGVLLLLLLWICPLPLTVFPSEHMSASFHFVLPSVLTPFHPPSISTYILPFPFFKLLYTSFLPFPWNLSFILNICSSFFFYLLLFSVLPVCLHLSFFTLFILLYLIFTSVYVLFLVRFSILLSSLLIVYLLNFLCLPLFFPFPYYFPFFFHSFIPFLSFLLFQQLLSY